jgi:ABC-type antimicrobial peptide transport system permease subunit
VGIYGVAAHVVALERRDIGIRMALGARARPVVRQVLARTLLAVLAGALCGIVGAGMLTRLVSGLLYGVTPLDPAAFAAALGALLVAALLAAAVPAHRAASVDPALTLRADA